jgi:hypothetical protein
VNGHEKESHAARAISPDGVPPERIARAGDLRDPDGRAIVTNGNCWYSRPAPGEPAMVEHGRVGPAVTQIALIHDGHEDFRPLDQSPPQPPRGDGACAVLAIIPEAERPRRRRCPAPVRCCSGFAECRLPELPAVLDHRPKLQLDQALRVTSANRHAGSSLHRYARRLVEDPDLLAMRFDPDREHTGGAE